MRTVFATVGTPPVMATAPLLTRRMPAGVTAHNDEVVQVIRNDRQDTGPGIEVG